MRKAVWLGTASIGALLTIASPAVAQEGNAAGQAATGNVGGDIVVTARRREELAQDTPVAVSVVTAERLQSAGIQNIMDLTKLVPGVNFTFQNSVVSTSLSVRGQSRGPSGDAQPSVVSYINEVPTAPSLSAIPSYDLSSIQVLKGPQGTLFGRNTTAGAVLVTTQRPRHEMGASVNATFGSYNWQEVTGVLNIPIVKDAVALRLAGNITRRDGYIKVINHPGKRMNGQDIDNYRISLLLEPTDWLSNVTVYESNKYNLLNTGSVLNSYTPGGTVDRVPYYNGTLGSLIPLLPCNGAPICNIAAAASRQAAAGPYKAWLTIPPSGEGRAQSLINTTTLSWDWGQLKNIFGYRKISISNFGDADGTEAPIVGAAGENNSRQISNELQLSGDSFDDALTWIVGAFAIDSRPSGPNQVSLQAFAAPGVPFTSPVFPGNSPNPLTAPFYGAYGASVFYRSESYAGYGQINYKLDQLVPALTGVSIDIGARHTKDKSSVCSIPGIRVIDPLPLESACPAATRARTESSKTTYTLGLNWQATNNVLAYVVTRSGYRAGGINAPVLGGTLTPFQSFEPQTVRDVEIGLKTAWNIGGMPGILNIAAYDSRYKKLQQNIIMAAALQTVAGPDGDSNPTNNPINASLTVNVGDATIRGLEVDFGIEPLPGLNLAASAAWLDKKITKVGIVLPATTLITLDNAAVESAAFVSAPDYSFTLSGTYDLPLPGDLGNLVFGASYFKIGEVQFQALRAPSWDRLDLTLDWRNVAGSNMNIGVFANNVTDKVSIISGGSTSAGTGFTSAFYGPPRMYGVKLSVALGGEARR
jgi:iron complex outermembrane receptor protein